MIRHISILNCFWGKMSAFSVAQLVKSVDQWSDIPKKISTGDQGDRTLEPKYVESFQRDASRVCRMWSGLALTICDVIAQEDGQSLKQFVDHNFPNLIGGSTSKMISDIKGLTFPKWEVQIVDLFLNTSPTKNKVIKCNLKMNGQHKIVEVTAQSRATKADFVVVNPQKDRLIVDVTKGKDKEVGKVDFDCQDLEDGENHVLQIKNDMKIVGKLTLRVTLINNEGPTLLNHLQETIHKDMMDHICRALNLEPIEKIDPPSSLVNSISLEITCRGLDSNNGDVLVFANEIPIPVSSTEPTLVPITQCSMLYFRRVATSIGSSSKRRSSLKDLIFSSGLEEDDKTISLHLSQVHVKEPHIVEIDHECSLKVKWTTEGDGPFHVDVDAILRVLVWSKLRILSKIHLMNWFGVLDSLVFQDVQNLFGILIPLDKWNRSKNEALLACHRLIPFNSFLMFEVLTELLDLEEIKNNPSSSLWKSIQDFLHYAANYLNESLFSESYENSSQIYGSFKCIAILQELKNFSQDFLVPYENLVNEKLIRTFFNVFQMKELLIIFQQRVLPTILILKDNEPILVASWLKIVSKTFLNHMIPKLKDTQEVVPLQVFKSCVFFVNANEQMDQTLFLDIFRPHLKNWIKTDLEENQQKICQIIELRGDWLENIIHIREILNESLQIVRSLSWPEPDVQDCFHANSLDAMKELIIFYVNSIQDEPEMNLIATVTTIGFWLSFLKPLEFKGIAEIMKDSNTILDGKFEHFLALEKRRLVELTQADSSKIDFEAPLKRTDNILKCLYENLLVKVRENLEHDSIIKEICYWFYYDELIPKYFSLVQSIFGTNFNKYIKNKLSHPDKWSDLIQSYTDSLDELIAFETRLEVEHNPEVIQIQKTIQAQFVRASELIAKDMDHLHHQIQKSFPDGSLESRGELRYKIAILAPTRQVVIKLLSLSKVIPLPENSSANPRISVSLIPHTPSQRYRHMTPIQYDTTCCAFDLLNQDEDILFDLPTTWRNNEQETPLFVLIELFDHWQLHPSAPATQKLFRGMSLVRVDQIKGRLMNHDQLSDLDTLTDQLVSIASLRENRSKEFQILAERSDETCVVHTRRQNYRFQEIWINEMSDALDCVSGYRTSNNLSQIILQSERQLRHMFGKIRKGFRNEFPFMEVGTTNQVQTNIPKWPLR